jgi:hypothetical protein
LDLDSSTGGKRMKIESCVFELDRIDHNKVTEQQSIAIRTILPIFISGKFVIFKDGTWDYIPNGNTWEYEGTSDWLLTIDLSKGATFEES